jgi:hypothetical protein
MAHDGDVERAAAPVPVSRVSGRIHALGPPSPPGPDRSLDPMITIHVPAIARWLTALGVVTAAVLAVLFQDARWGLVGGASVVGGIVLRRLASRVSFSFGEGFLPYRSDLGWPRGVQEDDDFHWAWADGRRR